MELERRDNPDAGTVSGLLYLDVNQDYIRNPEEPGIQGATVIVYDDDVMNGISYTTDASGYYNFDNVPDHWASTEFIAPPNTSYIGYWGTYPMSVGSYLEMGYYIEEDPGNGGDDPPIGPMMVSVNTMMDAGEVGQSEGQFYLERTGEDLSHSLTVYFTLGGTDVDAEEGIDFATIAHEVTFEPYETLVEVNITPLLDNEFEDTEFIRLTLIPSVNPDDYSITSDMAELSLYDDPPQVQSDVRWNESGSSIMGQITITRSGGDVSKALTTWVEVEGSYQEGEDAFPIIFAELVTIPAGESTVYLDIADSGAANNSPFLDVGLAGGGVPQVRPDTSPLLEQFMGAQPKGGESLADALLNLSYPLSYQEFDLVRGLAKDSASYALFFSSTEQLNIAVSAAKQVFYREELRVDWRTLPRAADAFAGGAGVVAQVMITDGWAKVKQKVDGYIVGFAAPVYRVRDKASTDIRILITSTISKSDLGRLSLILQSLEAGYKLTSDREVKLRITNAIALVKYSGYFAAYQQYKIEAAAALIGGGAGQ